MKRSCVLLVTVLVWATASPLRAQRRDADVLSPGEFRISAGAEYQHADAVFADGDNEPLGRDLDGPLTPVTFTPLAAVQARVLTFLNDAEPADGANPVDPPELFAGNLAVEAATNLRYLPLSLSIGILPRVEVGVALPVYRRERIFERFELAGGNVGLNPDAAGNAGLLGAISEAGTVLGNSPVLPLAESPLGMELQRLVTERTGQTLALPDTALTGTGLREAFPNTATPRRVDPWQAGDLELRTRIEILRTFDEPAYPRSEDGGIQYRLTALANLRFPTGQRPLPDAVLGSGTIAGFGGARVGAIGDLFAGKYFWLSAGGSFERLQESDVDVLQIPPEGPFAAGVAVATVRRSPGDRVEAWVAPRIRLTREFAIGALLQSDRRGDGSDTSDSGIFTIPGGSRHSVGFSLRYTTLPARTESGGPLPIEAAVGYSRALSGSNGLLASDVAFFDVSIRGRLW